MPIVMKYDGVDGESKLKGFEKYSEVTSFEFGVGRRIAAARGASTREGGDASLSEIVVRKKTDGSSVGFLTESIIGDMKKTVEIAFLRTGAGQPEEYLNFKLENTGVSGLSFKSDGGQDARPTETLHLNFWKLSMRYTPIGDDLTGSPNEWGYNMNEGAPL